LHTLEQRARNQIFADLKAQARIETDADYSQLRYKPLHNVNADGLAEYLALFTHGIPYGELMDAYKGVVGDINQLLKEGKIYTIEYREKSTATAPALIIFPRDDMGIKVDADIRQMWQRGMEDIPKGSELDFALFKQSHLSKEQFTNGHFFKAQENARTMQMAAAAVQAAAAEKKLKRKKTTQGALTNTHLLGKFAFIAEMPAAKAK